MTILKAACGGPEGAALRAGCRAAASVSGYRGDSALCWGAGETTSCAEAGDKVPVNRASILVHDFLKNSELLQAAKAAVELKTRESVLKKLNEIREDQKAQKAGIYRKAKSEPDR